MSRFLLINPRSGSADRLDDVLEAAEQAGVTTRVLSVGEDPAALARSVNADVLGMAGGDGSLGAVATVAFDRDVPFVCIPFGTRNHFARDAGLPDDPVEAIAAFEGTERRVDVGRAGDRLFLNNVSFGAYAHLVHRREKHRRPRAAFARLRAFAIAVQRPAALDLQVNGECLRAAVLLVSNNEYRLDVLSLGERDRIDEGAIAVYATERLFPWSWSERRGTRFEIQATSTSLKAAVDGEPADLETPIELRIEPLALRLLQPPA